MSVFRRSCFRHRRLVFYVMYSFGFFVPFLKTRIPFLLSPPSDLVAYMLKIRIIIDICGVTDRQRQSSVSFSPGLLYTRHILGALKGLIVVHKRANTVPLQQHSFDANRTPKQNPNSHQKKSTTPQLS